MVFLRSNMLFVFLGSVGGSSMPKRSIDGYLCFEVEMMGELGGTLGETYILTTLRKTHLDSETRLEDLYSWLTLKASRCHCNTLVILHAWKTSKWHVKFDILYTWKENKKPTTIQACWHLCQVMSSSSPKDLSNFKIQIGLVLGRRRESKTPGWYLNSWSVGVMKGDTTRGFCESHISRERVQNTSSLTCSSHHPTKIGVTDCPISTDGLIMEGLEYYKIEWDWNNFYNRLLLLWNILTHANIMWCMCIS